MHAKRPPSATQNTAYYNALAINALQRSSQTAHKTASAGAAYAPEQAWQQTSSPNQPPCRRRIIRRIPCAPAGPERHRRNAIYIIMCERIGSRTCPGEPRHCGNRHATPATCRRRPRRTVLRSHAVRIKKLSHLRYKNIFIFKQSGIKRGGLKLSFLENFLQNIYLKIFRKILFYTEKCY